MPVQCLSCESPNPDGNNFCGHCGCPLASAPAPRPGGLHTTVMDRGQDLGERRHVSVLFCDLVDSTAIAGRLDPEELRDLFTAYRRCCAQTASELGGHVAELQGDGTVVYFGHPHVHEDSAERAVLTGLTLCQRIPALRAIGGVSLSVRVGIASGHVLVDGLMVDMPKLALGVAPNLAARLEKFAPTNGLVVDDSVRELAGNLFRYESLGRREVRGIKQPVHIWRVVSDVRTATRFWALRGERMQPLVGRSRQLAILRELVGEIRGGTGRCVLITGEAGIGKSRLVHAFTTDSLAGVEDVMQFAFSSYHQSSSLYPFVAFVRQAAGIAAGSEQQEAQQRLADWLAGNGVTDHNIQKMYQRLCGSGADTQGEAILYSQTGRRAFLESLCQLLLNAGAQARPSVLVFEDTHWADPSTLELLRMLRRRIGTLPVLLVMTSRERRKPDPGSVDPIVELDLGGLNDTEADTLIDLIAEPRTLTRGDRERILARCDGIPLYVEELTRMFLDADESPRRARVEESAIPDSLHDLLQARLERVTGAKSVAQAAAVIGREFDVTLLGRILPADLSPDLPRILASLQESGLVQGRDHPDRYQFRHMLIQEAAYSTLTREHLRSLHRSIADELLRGGTVGGQDAPELIAEHYSRANAPYDAAQQWVRAGRNAARLASHSEAIAHYSRALQALEATPSTSRTRDQEFSILTALAAQSTIVKGNGHRDVHDLFRRSLGLAEKMKDQRRVFRCARGLHTYYLVRGELMKALEQGERLVRIASEEKSDDLLLHAYRPQALCHLYLGEFADSNVFARRALSLYNPERHAVDRFEYGSDASALCHSNIAWIRALVGDFDPALEHAERATDIARSLSHPHTIAFTLAFLTSVAQFSGKIALTQRHAETLLELSSRHDFSYWIAWGNALRAWSLRHDDPAAAVKGIRDAVKDYRATGARLMVPYFLTLLCEAQIDARRFSMAARTAASAVLAADCGSVRFYLPETLKLRARALIDSRAPDTEIESCQEDVRVLLAHRSGLRERIGRSMEEIPLASQQPGSSLELPH